MEHEIALTRFSSSNAYGAAFAKRIINFSPIHINKANNSERVVWARNILLFNRLRGRKTVHGDLISLCCRGKREPTENRDESGLHPAYRMHVDAH